MVLHDHGVKFQGMKGKYHPIWISSPLDQEQNFVKKEDNHVLQIFFSLNLFMVNAMSVIDNNLLFFGQWQSSNKASFQNT